MRTVSTDRHKDPLALWRQNGVSVLFSADGQSLTEPRTRAALGGSLLTRPDQL